MINNHSILSAKRLMTAFLIANVIAVSAAHADIVVTDWTGFTSNSATGILNGISISGTRNAGGPFYAITTNNFSNPGAWNAPMPLPVGTKGIAMGPLNAGADHIFEFSSPISSILFYVDDFDSFSDAVLTASGATSMEMIAATSNMFFDPISNSGGRLWTTNGGFNGIADAVIRINGSVESLRLQYTNGIQSNGVFYTFAMVPEPNSAVLLVFAFGYSVLRRNRKSTLDRVAGLGRE